jgi:glycosyltransferase involved in cell wall biosynthesis
MSSSGPLVSFVVPCYNYGRFLPDCLASIFNQHGDYPFEIIAIDDASSDNTREVLANLHDPRLKVIRHEKNEGHVSTISQGLRESRGAYVARIDPDDRYRPCFLSRVIPVLARHPEVGFVYGDAALIGPNGELYVAHSDRSHGGHDCKGNELLQLLLENIVCAPTVIARREAWLGTLPVPPNLAFSDWYFNLMIARRYEFYYVSEVLAEYRVHDSNHHSRIVVNRTEEPSIRLLLDRIFAEIEEDPALELRKRAWRGRVYSSQYLTLADKYFGAGMPEDARRCYREAAHHSLRYSLSFTFLRRLLATYLRPDAYRGLKRLLGRSAI